MRDFSIIHNISNENWRTRIAILIGETRMTSLPKKMWFGPLIGGAVAIACSSGLTNDMQYTLAVTIWVALWWVFEVVPIPITSLIPFVLFPMGGILSNKIIAQAYGHWLIILLMGGFMLSTMIERSDLHRRFAVSIIRTIGVDSPRRLLLGVMVATSIMSAWISNTATTLIVLPIVLALGRMAEDRETLSTLLLGLAYSASIGGMATPIGTPPNIVLLGVLEETTGETIPFLSWMLFAVPIAISLLLLTWVMLGRRLKSSLQSIDLPQLKPMNTHQSRVLAIFGLVVMMWVFRSQPFGGWTGLFPSMQIGDDTVALLGVVLAFVVPSGTNGERVLTWDAAKEIPWGLLLLFGGGIAIAKAFQQSGLSQVIGEGLVGLQELPFLLMIVGLCLAVTFLTEVTSNTATTTLLMPILVSAAIASQMDPKLWMVPAALSASCAFMLPVATAPNAIVFGSGVVSTQDMSRTGIQINLIGVVVISLGTVWLL